MDGLDDSSGNGHNISNTDTSQDEVDASSPSGKYKRFGRHGVGLNGAAGADAGAGIHRSPQGTHAGKLHSLSVRFVFFGAGLLIQAWHCVYPITELHI